MYWNISDEDRLIEAFRLANTAPLIKNFLKDILTEKEIKDCVARLKVACMLCDGASYKEIEMMTGFSSPTISKISKKMINKEGGFQTMLRKMNPDGLSYFE